MKIATSLLLKKILPLFRPYQKELILGGIFMIIYVSCWPILADIAGKLIPAIGSGEVKKVFNLILISLIIFSIQKFCQFYQDVLLAKPSLNISANLRNNLFFNLQKIELGSLEKLSSGDITYRLTEDADRVGEIIYTTIQDSIPSSLQLVAVFIFMIYVDWQLSLATLFLAPLVTLLVSYFGSKVLNAAERSQQKVSDLASLLGEAVQGLSLVRAFAAEDWILRRFSEKVDQHKDTRFKTLKLLALQHPVVGFIEAAGILTILAIGTARINIGGLSSEGFSSYIAAVLMLIDPISHLTKNFNEFKQGEASLKRLYEIEYQKREYQDVINPKSLTNPKGDIKFNDVSFSYNQIDNVIDNINIRIKSGTTIALVGPSGAGKSTIFSLLLRFYIPTSGKILFDDIDISLIKSNTIRENIALVPQRLTVFSGTIYEAIKFGRVGTDKQVIKAAKIANADEFIERLPLRYETRLEEGGRNLSGGQLQRINIARAMFGDPALLLLDEATSALDADSEQAVQIAIKQAMAGRTVFIIAHKLSTIQESDLIIYLEKGRIKEMGTHNNLIMKNGKYKELCQKQFLRNTF